MPIRTKRIPSCARCLSHLSESAQAFAALPPSRMSQALHPLNAGLLSLGMLRFSRPCRLLPPSKPPTTATPPRPDATPPPPMTGSTWSWSVARQLLATRPSSDRSATPPFRRSPPSSRRRWPSTPGADILIVAVGVPVVADLVREGAIVIDIGTTPSRTTPVRLWATTSMRRRREPIAEAVSPVPGGVVEPPTSG